MDNLVIVGSALAVVGTTIATGYIDWQTAGICVVIVLAVLAHLWLQSYDRR